MQSRYNAMKEQKIYLSQQLKATMKINRVLQVLRNNYYNFRDTFTNV